MAGVCHCKNYQRQTGSAFSALVGFPISDIDFGDSELSIYEDAATESSSVVQRFFCGECGSPIYSQVPAQSDTAYLKTGILDDTSSFKPMFNLWFDSKQDWVTLYETIPTMGEQT
jgi:hypothetical protein